MSYITAQESIYPARQIYNIKWEYIIQIVCPMIEILSSYKW